MSQAKNRRRLTDKINGLRLVLVGLSPFSSWPAVALDRLCAEARVKCYAPGEYVYRMNDSPKGIWIVREGWFQVSRTWANGRRAVLDHQQPGQMTGIVPVFDGLPAPFDYIARVPASMIFIPKKPFLEILGVYPQLLFGITALLCRRARLDYAWHATSSLHSPRAIVAKTLLYMIRGHIRSSASILDVPVRISQEDLASLWGMSRQSFNAEISRFSKQGILARRYRRLVVLDVARLIKVVTDEEGFDPFERAILFPDEKNLRTAM